MPSLHKDETRFPAELSFPIKDSVRQLTWEELPHMERNAQEALKAHLMETNPEFQRLASQHSEFAKRLDALGSLPHLTEEEQLEETRLKKLKLRIKDQMEAILSQYRSQQVA